MAIALLHTQEHPDRVYPTLRSLAQELRGALALMVMCTVIAIAGICWH